MQIMMPQLGETIVEGTILRWLKAEGESVALDEPLFEISTDKVDTEVPAPAAGVLTRILVPEGQTVAVGTLLAEMDAAGETPEGAPATAAPLQGDQPGAAGPGAPPPPMLANAAEAGPPPVPQPPVVAEPAAAGAAPTPAAPADQGPRSGILSPVVRRLAAEHGVDLSQVRGTGAGGRVTRADVEARIAAGAPAADHPAAPAAGPVATASPVARPATDAKAPVAPPSADEEIVPMTNLRRAIGEHMAASLRISARAWTMVEVDMERVVRLREQFKEAFRAREGFGLTYMPFVARAVAESLLAFPMVNAELRGDDLVLHHAVHLGIAVSIEGGLIVPVVKEADGMSLVGLARSIHDLAERARSKQLLPDEVHQATFTITNPGPFGSVLSVPIINQPNSAILSFDAIEKRPVVVDDAIAIRHMVYLSMSWDHRVIDGALATQFLARIKEYLEQQDFAEDLAP
jgi:pyruvate dehydrogenase E2 component (dihydrolipoyllysine-residue acetyltransferase)